MLYGEVPFLDRFALARRSGFAAVEFLFPYEAGVDAIKSRIDDLGLTIALFNLPPGDRPGEWGTLSNPGRIDYFRSSFDLALESAIRLGCRRLHVMFGNRAPEVLPEEQVRCALDNLAWAAPQAEQAGITLLVEALNPIEFPAFMLHTASTALDVVVQAAHPFVMLQYDVYQAQMATGNLIDTITACFPHIGHIQIGDVPGRHEPGTGEINYPNVFAALERLGYTGYIGLEYRPSGETDASLAWLPREARGLR